MCVGIEEVVKGGGNRKRGGLFGVMKEDWHVIEGSEFLVET